MAEQEPISTRTTLAVAAAACSLTLAAGITAAALFGYVGPGRQPAMGEGSGSASATRAADSTAADSGVVLVPVQPATAEPAIEANADDPAGLRLVSARDDDRERHARGDARHEEDEDEREDD